MRRSTILMASLGLVACTGARSTAVAPPSPATQPESTTTTTVAFDTANATIRGDVPYPDTSGDDWLRIASELHEFGGWLFEHPTPDLVALWGEPGTPPFEALHSYLVEYADRGWRDLPGGRAEIRSADLQLLSDDGSLAQVLVVDDYDGAVTVDASGTVVKTDEDRPPGASMWKLRKTDEGWRIIEVTHLGPANWVAE